MATLRSLVILACCFQAIICQQEDTLSNKAVNENLACYLCQQSDAQSCGDPIDTTYLKKEPCNSLDYGHFQPRSDGTKLVAVSSLLKQVFGTMERFPNRILYEYECIKFVENNGVERGCIPKPANIEDGCDYFKKEAQNVKSCYTCTTDGCNGSTALKHSVFAVAALSFILFKL